MQLSNEELKNLIGGSLTASFLSALVRGFNFILDLGKTIGTAIRRGTSGNACSF